MLFNFFFSGHMFPVSMLPGGWATVVEAMPLMYLAYFPAAVFLGIVEGQDLVRGLIFQAAWVVFFIIVCRFALARGLQALQRIRRLIARCPINRRTCACFSTFHAEQPDPRHVVPLELHHRMHLERLVGADEPRLLRAHLPATRR